MAYFLGVALLVCLSSNNFANGSGIGVFFTSDGTPKPFSPLCGREAFGAVIWCKYAATPPFVQPIYVHPPSPVPQNVSTSYGKPRQPLLKHTITVQRGNEGARVKPIDDLVAPINKAKPTTALPSIEIKEGEVFTCPANSVDPEPRPIPSDKNPYLEEFKDPTPPSTSETGGTNGIHPPPVHVVPASYPSAGPTPNTVAPPSLSTDEIRMSNYVTYSNAKYEKMFSAVTEQVLTRHGNDYIRFIGQLYELLVAVGAGGDGFVKMPDGDQDVQDYIAERNRTLMAEESESFGGDLNLTWTEGIVNAILMRSKRREYDEGQDGTNGRHFDAVQHFFHARDHIKQSKVFQIIRLMPKGCALHVHDTTVGSVEWVAKHLTHSPDLYMCFDKDDDNHILFNFSSTRPTDNCGKNRKSVLFSEWISVAEFRKNASRPAYIEALFMENMSLYTNTPELRITDNDQAWYYFSRTIETVLGIVSYENAMKAYYWQVLKEFYEDNVMYIENRGHLTDIYRPDQSHLTAEEALNNILEVTENFKKEYPDFWGAKFIMTTIRHEDVQEMEKALDTAVYLKNKYPDFMPGFDIAFHEDLGKPNIEYLPWLLKARDQGLKYFFHAGETNWHGTKTDDNMLDAILLNSTRIGHGTALNGRPYLVDLIKKNKIGVEVNPISSQVLKIVSDFRNHPAVPWFKKGFPIVISSDDAGMEGSSGLSFDWYVAFMAMGGQRSDLRFLKQLAINSITYSAMSEQEKNSAMEKWNVAYNTFLHKVIRGFCKGIF